MILQDIVMPGKLNIDSQIYYRNTGGIYETECGIVLPKKSIFSTDTYMNGLDIGVWKKYTKIERFVLKIEICGKGNIIVWKESNKRVKQRMFVYQFESDGYANQVKKIFSMPQDLSEGIIYFEIHAEEDCILKSATFETEDRAMSDIKISIVVCTYKRRKQLEQLLMELGLCKKRDDGFDVRIIVIDNASELHDQYGENIQVYHNQNTGGSGGFARGMDETVKGIDSFPATHVLLMDDDVILQRESVYRLYALLSYVKQEYKNEVVAGRMFRLDKPHVQYTAAEIWNAGEVRHIGWNQDMTERNRLFDENENAGAEYSGWWFACFPIGFVKDNRPIPFFLHCDDVEYGLRHGGTPIILNGIQVWHETYEYRQSPVVAYYDMRNTLIVNAMYHLCMSDDDILHWWKSKITEKHVEKQYIHEHMMILGMRDYLRGKRYLETHDGEKKNQRLHKKKIRKITNSALWRFVQFEFLLCHSRVLESYQITQK